MGFLTPQQHWQLFGPLSIKMETRLTEILASKQFPFLDYDHLKTLNGNEASNRGDLYFWWRLFCLDEYVRVWNLAVTDNRV